MFVKENPDRKEKKKKKKCQYKCRLITLIISLIHNITKRSNILKNVAVSAFILGHNKLKG